jgi:response regulator RpfG family c-di-GMP phosphodiesterase
MALRTLDSVGRWGGEEFAAILPETNAEGAVMLAERVRSAVAGHTFAAAGLRLTCSVGIATFPDDGENRDLLVETADHAMYAAKRLGRNQVRSSADPAVRALGPMLDTARPRDDALLVGTMEALSALMEARRVGDDAPGIAGLAIRVARAMNADEAEVRLIGLAALLQDIGKAMVPGGILEKPGALTDEEWELVRAHPAVGADAVQRIPSLSPLAPIIRSHHERWDGAGYPDGMAGASIPPEARILGVVSAYTAMINDRPYRQRCDSRQALRELQRCAGTQFDPEVVEALADVLAAESSGESYERVG